METNLPGQETDPEMVTLPDETDSGDNTDLGLTFGGGGGILTTFEPCHCSFCCVELKVGEGVVLNGCLHNFCRNCLIVAIEESTSPQIPCPVGAETGCGGVLLDPEIKALVSSQSFQKYLNRSLKWLVSGEENQNGDVVSAPLGTHDLGGDDLNLVPCGSPGCSGFGDGASHNLEFKCCECDMINCLVCKNVRNGSILRCECLENEEYNPPMKKAKIEIDPDVAKDWEAKWTLLSASVNSDRGSNIDQVAGPSSGNSSQTSRDALLAMSIWMDESQLIISQQEFDCPICFCGVEKGQGVILKDCFHTFCKTCLTAVIEHSEGATVLCPHRLNEDVCSSTISDREIKSLVSPQFYETFLRRSVTTAELRMENTFHCKTADCESFWEMDTADMEGEVVCPACHKKNCLKCKAVHEAVSCQEYRARLMQDEMDIKTKTLLQKKVNKGIVMKCPTCKVIIEKNGGCSHMTCSFCRTDFNWKADKGDGDLQGTGNRAQLVVPTALGGRRRGRGLGTPIPETYQGLHTPAYNPFLLPHAQRHLPPGGRGGGRYGATNRNTGRTPHGLGLFRGGGGGGRNRRNTR